MFFVKGSFFVVEAAAFEMRTKVLCAEQRLFHRLRTANIPAYGDRHIIWRCSHHRRLIKEAYRQLDLSKRVLAHPFAEHLHHEEV